MGAHVPAQQFQISEEHKCVHGVGACPLPTVPPTPEQPSCERTTTSLAIRKPFTNQIVASLVTELELFTTSHQRKEKTV